MKKLVWLAGLLLAVSIVFPNGPTFTPVKPVTPVAPVVPAPATDATIVKLLTGADAADKARIESVYTGLLTVLKRDGGKSVSTTEKWAAVQARTLELAVDQPGKYPGLDEAIEAVFLNAVGTDDVVAVNADYMKKLVSACEVILSSVAAAK